MSKYVPCNLTVHLTELDIVILQQAVNFRKKPRTWRASEYAVTKASAARHCKTLHPGDNTLELFDWSVLQGELARLYSWGKAPQMSRSDVLAVYEKIQQTILNNDHARKIEEADRNLHQALRDVAKADQVAAAARDKLEKLRKAMED